MFKGVLKKAFSSALETFDIPISGGGGGGESPLGSDHGSPSGLKGNISRMIPMGKKRLRITNYVDEGGFSYVYKCIDEITNRKYALKRLLIQSTEQKTIVDNEIATMKALTGHVHVIGIHGVSRTDGNNGTFVYILMELGNGSVLDLMNDLSTQNQRFTEKQLLLIFHETCLGIHHMHSQEPPVQHRDVKVENVLRASKRFKLCDFGSCTTSVYNLRRDKHARPIAEDDINKNTTLEYRAPEMVDLYSNHVIDCMADIWALGCMLYKMMFFQGPFDEAGAMSIMAGNYKIPKNNFSKPLVALLKKILNTNPDQRPDIVELIEEVAELRGMEKGDLKRGSYLKNRLQRIQRVGHGKAKSHKGAKKKKKKNLFDQLDTEKQKEQQGFDDWDPFNEKTTSPSMVPENKATEPQQEEGGGDALFAMLDWQEESPQETQQPGKKKLEKKLSGPKLSKKLSGPRLAKKLSGPRNDGLIAAPPRRESLQKKSGVNDFSDGFFQWDDVPENKPPQKIQPPPKKLVARKRIKQNKTISFDWNETQSQPKQQTQQPPPAQLMDFGNSSVRARQVNPQHKGTKCKTTIPSSVANFKPHYQQQYVGGHPQSSQAMIMHPRVKSFDNFQVPNHQMNQFRGGNYAVAGYRNVHSPGFLLGGSNGQMKGKARNNLYGHQDKPKEEKRDLFVDFKDAFPF